MIKIILVGDRSENVIAHRAIPEALKLAALKAGIEVQHEWIGTEQISELLDSNADGIWCVPGSPYRNMEGALMAIRFARETGVPFLGTCGGFQHALIEYARNVLRLREADHAESNPNASLRIIDKLSCALVNRSEAIQLVEGSKLRGICGSANISEEYQCSYGLSDKARELFAKSPMKFTAFGASGEVRAFELTDHRFYVGTLFQPERQALRGVNHPIVAAFVGAASGLGLSAA